MFYGSQIWDPVLIIAQIVTIQCLFYITYGLLLWVLVGPYVSGRLTLSHFFGANWLGFHSFVSWMAILANVCNAVPVSVVILLVVERAKKCLDFSATVYLLHLLAASICAGFPRTAAWWLANGVAFVVTAVTSGLGKRRQETELLPLNALPTQPAAAGQKPASLLSRIAATMRPGAAASQGAREGSRGTSEV